MLDCSAIVQYPDGEFLAFVKAATGDLHQDGSFPASAIAKYEFEHERITIFAHRKAQLGMFRIVRN